MANLETPEPEAQPSDGASPGAPSDGAHPGGRPEAPSDEELLERAAEATRQLRAAIASAVVGQDAVVERMLVTLAARGHALLVGVPGLAKTLLVAWIESALDLPFRRAKFTPDLPPAEITPTEVLHERAGHKSLA